MERETLRHLHAQLRFFRSRQDRQYKYLFERDGDLIRIITVVPVGRLKITEYMTPGEMLRWFEGFACGSERIDQAVNAAKAK